MPQVHDADEVVLDVGDLVLVDQHTGANAIGAHHQRDVRHRHRDELGLELRQPELQGKRRRVIERRNGDAQAPHLAGPDGRARDEHRAAAVSVRATAREEEVAVLDGAVVTRGERDDVRLAGLGGRLGLVELDALDVVLAVLRIDLACRQRIDEERLVA